VGNKRDGSKLPSSRAGVGFEPTLPWRYLLGIVKKMLGFDRIFVNCQDGHERLCRIRGKLKRRVWIRQRDIVLVSPWDFQSDKRGDIIWRYKRNQAEWLRKNGYLKI